MPIIFNPAPIVASTMAMHTANRRRREQEEAARKERLAKAIENVKNKEENKK